MRLFGNAFKQIYGSLTLTSPAGQTALNVQDSGGSIIGNPTGGPQGANTLNVAGGIFVNGSPVASSTVNAGSLVGTTLASGVVNSSLTSVGTLSAGVVPTSLLSGNFPAANLSGGTLAAGVTASSLTSVGAITSGSFPAANLSGATLAAGVTASSLTQLGNVTTGTFPASNLSGTGLSTSVVSSSLTSVGTLGSLAVTGAITSGSLAATGNVSGASGTISGQSQEGSTLVGSPTGGNKGAGSINAQSIFVNGVAVGSGGTAPTYFVKPADTARSVTSASADPDLVTGTLAAGTYDVTVVLGVSTTTSSQGLNLALPFNGGTGSNQPIMGLVQDFITGNVGLSVGNTSTVPLTFNSSGSTVEFVGRCTLVVTSPGILSISWSAVAAAASTTMKAGSFLSYLKIA